MRSSYDAELELVRVMDAPPALDVYEVGRWLGRLQSLLAEVRRAKVREARKKVGQ